MRSTKDHFKTIFIRFLGVSGALFVALLLCTYILIPADLTAPITGYLLSFLFIGIDLLVVRNFRGMSNNQFYMRFFISIGIRFILVFAVFVVILLTLNIHQIYFTVSFIISYILHSGIEIFYVNKLLETDN